MAPVNRIVTGIAIAIIALVVAGSFVVAGQLPGMSSIPSTNNPVAIVHDADGEVHALPLSRNASVTVETSLGTNTVTVEDGEARISASDCDGHDCMRQGSISAALANKQLICLPHKLWVEIRTSEGTGQLNPDAAANDGGHLPEGGIDEFGEGLDTFAR